MASGGQPSHRGQFAGESIADERGVRNHVGGPQGTIADVIDRIQRGEVVSDRIGGNGIVLPGDADVG